MIRICEKVGLFPPWNMILWYWRHISFHCEGAIKCNAYCMAHSQSYKRVGHNGRIIFIFSPYLNHIITVFLPLSFGKHYFSELLSKNNKTIHFHPFAKPFFSQYIKSGQRLLFFQTRWGLAGEPLCLFKSFTEPSFNPSLVTIIPHPWPSPGTPWDPLGSSHRVPEEELKSEFNRKVAQTIIPGISPILGHPCRFYSQSRFKFTTFVSIRFLLILTDISQKSKSVSDTDWDC